MLGKAARQTPPIWWKIRKTGKKTIGVLSPGYGLEKVSYSLMPNGFSYVKLNQIPFHRIFRTDNIFTQTNIVIGGGADLIHTFNTIPVNRPFVISFETELPRFLGHPTDWAIEFGYSMLQSSRCRGIYALSKAGRNFSAKRMRARGFADLADQIQIFRGGITIPQTDTFANLRPLRGEIRACFVGGHLFHKGIEAVIRATEQLRLHGIDITLTVVGKCRDSTYAAPDVLFNGNQVLSKFDQCSWITYYPQLPNAEILKLFFSHHLLFFPSIDESLGWVLVEAAMCGLPRIATNIFAFPELIHHGRDGWMIDIPLNDDRRWSFLGKPEAKDVWDDTQKFMSERILDIFGDNNLSVEKLIEVGATARDHINYLYGQDKARAQLESIYESALK